MEEDSAKCLLSVRATKPAATARLTGHGLKRCSEGADRRHGNWAEHLHLEMLMRQHPDEGFSRQSASGKDAYFKVL